MEINREISKFLSEAPLYKKQETLIELYGPNDMAGYTFNSFCENEKEIQTFELEVFPESAQLYAKSVSERPFNLGNTIEPPKVNYTQHYRAKCKSCNKYYRDIIINVFTEIPYSAYRKTGDDKPKFYLRKIGQYPPFEIVPDNEVSKYLTKEDNEFYKKALMNLSSSYGIGAFAYLRRIAENEIHRILEDLSKFENENSDEVKKLLVQHQQDHKMQPLLEKVFQFLPSSLKVLGDNPIKLIHEQLSIGLHGLSDDQCFDRAKSLDTILTFVIKKISEEKSVVKDIRLAIQNLKKAQQ